MSTAAPTNVFFVIDDYAISAGTGMGSGLPVSCDFVAPSVAAATQTAYLFATIMQSSVRLVNKFNQGSTFASTQVLPGPANVALTVSPSGVFAVSP